MMRTVGHITPALLEALKVRGMSPKQACDAIMREAEARHPQARSVVIRPALQKGAFDVVAID